jgi:hypothetical protein
MIYHAGILGCMYTYAPVYICTFAYSYVYDIVYIHTYIYIYDTLGSRQYTGLAHGACMHACARACMHEVCTRRVSTRDDPLLVAVPRPAPSPLASLSRERECEEGCWNEKERGGEQTEAYIYTVYIYYISTCVCVRRHTAGCVRGDEAESYIRICIYQGIFMCAYTHTHTHTHTHTYWILQTRTLTPGEHLRARAPTYTRTHTNTHKCARARALTHAPQGLASIHTPEYVVACIITLGDGL